MCRLLAYKGAPIVLDTLLYQPKNSLIKQSYDAKEIEEPLNGDGFGIGWYAPELHHDPAVFVSVFPAWSNRNLRSLSPRIQTQCLFAHVRAASFGDISEANCHPFQFGKFLMMHNGSIEGFDTIKRTLRRRLSDRVYSWVKGQTDSEHFFALFIDKVLALGDEYTVHQMAEAMHQSINDLLAIKREAGLENPTYLNTVVTDGKMMVGTRFLANGSEDPLTLYWSEGARYICEDGVCHMVAAGKEEQAVLIVSEKLTGLRSDWRKIPDNNLILVDQENQVTFRPVVVDSGLKVSA